jgi:hypothetical protein
MSDADVQTRPVATPNVMRFVCSIPSCKTEMRFPPKTKYEDANAEIGRRGWAIMQIPVSAHNCRWGLCCGDCVKTLGG